MYLKNIKPKPFGNCPPKHHVAPQLPPSAAQTTGDLLWPWKKRPHGRLVVVDKEA